MSLRALDIDIAQGIRSWTGRSAMSRATETGLSRYATAGARQTRVSAMRAAARRPRRTVGGTDTACRWSVAHAGNRG